MTTATSQFHISTGKLFDVMTVYLCFTGAEDIQIDQNYDTVTVKRDDEVNLTCSSKVQYYSCIFTSPSGDTYNIIEGIQ